MLEDRVVQNLLRRPVPVDSPQLSVKQAQVLVYVHGVNSTASVQRITEAAVVKEAADALDERRDLGSS